MKTLIITINKISLIFALTSCFIFVTSCDKSLEELSYPQLNPSSTEEKGGAWKTIVVASSLSIAVPEPLSTSSSEYASEINELKTLSSSLTSSEKTAVKFWSAGGVLRWNEITRELIAKYNLPPVANPDGTYPVPDATKPTNYPEFPFANPPYATRALALLSVAQYDALVSAWYYKYQYNRPAPYQIDQSIISSMPKSNLPSYPSEDAVVASVSFELLKFLFPGEVDFLKEKAAEHKNSRIWGGANVKSDIAAGDSLGRKIAAEIIAYAKTDGMKNVLVFSPETRNAREQFAMQNFGTAWKSLESPARPPMLPNYGAVKNWLFDEATRVAIRPPAPPKIGSAEFEKDMEELRGFSKNITREQFRIVSFWADGVGTYTPPGHWNHIAADLITKNRLSELRSARTFALMNMALMDAGVCCWETKFYYFYPRPSQVDPSIKTATGVPNFPAYTSGHSTFSGAAATVLSYVFPSEKESLFAMAEEAAMSRVYGGIHYRFDSEAGLKCGNEIGEFAVKFGKADGSE